jgi:hypothetical protein
MTNTNNGRSIALVIIIIILALFAFRAVFFLLPFGVFPGLHRMAGEIAPSINGWFHGFGWIGRLAVFFLPALLIILWGAVLVWVYRDAQKRGMNGILWLLLVLIGNVIGLLIYAIVRSETPVRQPQGPADQPAGCPPVTCSVCGKPVGAGYAFCPYCGKNLKKTCPACGKPADDGWKVCPVCGANLDPSGSHNA